MATTLENGFGTQNITEDEAALYDRQIRLWGLEAQQRMRNATICVINLRGVATEVIKNIVLSGIGKLIVLDTEDVREEDLGAGFFFRETDVGQKRVDAAKVRIESLNPLVRVDVISNFGSSEWWDFLVKSVDIVCLTDGSRGDLNRINEFCRKHKKPFYGGGTYGLTGYIFCDLLIHEYISPDRSTSEHAKTIKHSVTYPSFSEALEHNWHSLSKKQVKHQNAEVLFSIFALWAYQLQHDTLPSDAGSVNDLESISNSLITSAHINPQVLPSVSRGQLEALASTAVHEFSPVCAIVGGLMGQDVLKVLGARDPPIANLFVFDGRTGSGAVSRLNMLS